LKLTLHSVPDAEEKTKMRMVIAAQALHRSKTAIRDIVKKQQPEGSEPIDEEDRLCCASFGLNTSARLS